ncbi:hypothetical protein [Algicola sagamiensis]|uniref:hypothetical protein n=1 Tax=Algicola sagamiensis TaxID=163869 RepID=UPI0003618F55|nr:hypothetical protein [Algicola sagamiensis]
MNKISVSVRYSLPKNKKEAMNQLAKILKVPTHKLNGDEEKIVIAMSGTILYRHLDRLNKMSVIQKIQDLSDLDLAVDLRIKCLDSLVKPQWAEWSLTNDELKEVLDFHNQLNRWSSILGANPGAYGVGGAAWDIVKNGASTGNIGVLIASIVIIGVHEFSYNETQKYSNELERRKVLN